MPTRDPKSLPKRRQPNSILGLVQRSFIIPRRQHHQDGLHASMDPRHGTGKRKSQQRAGGDLVGEICVRVHGKSMPSLHDL
ncbi:hypothetical protein NUU61_002625 [Penicillium alfredii]|uniref:Uncharacterized protein n=1 Tax=Penicillium alfredii TaxID=1506179 RepID=A0A9W9FRY1_9EURO|nr:uncharacterized protein NUU61_002625 [Penicillium alfredii]KAJ5105278.1 hypothetical protein NUU61_002625 [Penicillium alfredii]